ncbi:hypothetical protein [Longimicrobium sp.]|uniref:hypothetical protein n=1 Tax=Longimicrobium sp. TaxID=2029185 RepID=UPI002E32BD5C|nr:hypothetical protein [Longimicrobium sp.]HEX6040221.1 hypothetical protein [Longimicrobium sp.]
MHTQIHRTRLRPMWSAGLRRGRERNETMRLLRASPVMRERLCRINAQLAAWGVESMPLDRVKQPFDYAR